jgi:hypothetical protein
MTEAPINKLAVARRQLDCAIRLLGKEDALAIHNLAYDAYCVLRDLFGPSETLKVLKRLEKSANLREVPEYLKHAETDREDILNKHDEKHTRIIIALAIRLWTEHGQVETAEMRAFSALPDPFKTGYRASETLKYVREGVFSDPDVAKVHRQRLLTLTSTGGLEILRTKD